MTRINPQRLGRTDLMLSPIGVGCWQFSKGKGMTGRYWFSVLNRTMETNGVLDTAQELGIAIIAYSPLAQGLLTGIFHAHPECARDMRLFRRIYSKFSKDLLERSQPVVDVLTELAEVYQATAAQVALNWANNVHGELAFAISGASKPEQARQNVGAMNFTLSAGDIQRLNDISLTYSRKR